MNEKECLRMTLDGINHYMVLIGVLPAIILAVGILVTKFGYKISDADAEMYAKANQEKALEK